MGGIFIYKRYNARTDSNISMHFENPRAAYDAARVKMSKLNEITIRPQKRFNGENSVSYNPIYALC